ncbi:MAG: hypothetical protein KKB31_02260, partial [Nanoarchaeota archaeon]|nr:hypothetical protein [Nanoarchaeota archaeon]
MKRLRIKVYTTQLKTENGNIGARSEMLKLNTVIENYNSSETEKGKKNITLYKIKGLKGWLRHKYMDYYLKKGIEVCYSSSKENYKDRKLEIPKGFHLLGECKGKCPIYKIFGGIVTKKEASSELSKQSRINVWCNGVLSKTHFDKLKERKLKKYLKSKYNVMSYNSENSLCLGTDGQGIQNFGEKFVSGDFEFFIDVDKLDNEELKTLIDVLLNTDLKLGRGKTRGCGFIEIKQIKYEDVVIKNKIRE